MLDNHRIARAALLGATLVAAAAGCRVVATGTTTTTTRTPNQPDGAEGGVETRDHRGDRTAEGGVDTRDHRGEGAGDGQAAEPTGGAGDGAGTGGVIGPDRAGDRVTQTDPRPRVPTVDPSRPGTVTDPPGPRPGVIVEPIRPGIIIDPVRIKPGMGVIDIDPKRPIRGITPFSIEPTAGPVGTGVTIYGEFGAAKRLGDVGVTFGGGRSTRAVSVRPNAITVVVPKRAKTGPVTVRIKRKPVWTGRFTVTAVDNGLIVVTPVEMGLIGAVHKLPANTKKLPDFSRLDKPFSAIAMPTLDVAPRRFSAGFPGLGDGDDKLVEWFAIRFAGKLMLDKDAVVYFQLNSDDGAKLYIDGALVIDNDGIHPPAAKQGGIRLTKGLHEIVVEYFQGPRYEIALQLSWRFDPAAPWKPIPAAKLRRY